VVALWERRWIREDLLVHVDRPYQVAGIRPVEGGDGAKRGTRLLCCTTGAGFDFQIPAGRGFGIGGAWIGGRPCDLVRAAT